MATPQYCPYCGTRIPLGAKFCSECGANLPDTPSMGETLYTRAQNDYNSQQSYNYNAPPMYGSQPKKNAGGLIAIGVITIVLAVFAALVGISCLCGIDLLNRYYTDSDVILIRKALIIVGAVYLALAIVGLIGGIDCFNRKHYGRGLAMYIIALVICVLFLLLSFGWFSILRAVIAIVLLVVYTSNKQNFIS